MSSQKVVASRFFSSAKENNSNWNSRGEAAAAQLQRQNKCDELPEKVDKYQEIKLQSNGDISSSENKMQKHKQNDTTVQIECMGLSQDKAGRVKENNLRPNALETQNSNPFAHYAFSSESQSTAKSSTKPKVERDCKWVPQCKSEPVKKKAKRENWIPFVHLSEKEQVSVKRKWHGLTINEGEPLPLLEELRFQVFVASRLHARCQESVVRKCMRSLHENRVLSCKAMATADPEVLANLLTSLQYYNTKSKHLVKASNEMLEKFEGKVPERHDELLQLTGIGPVMADLLSNVNTRDAYQNIT